MSCRAGAEGSENGQRHGERLGGGNQSGAEERMCRPVSDAKQGLWQRPSDQVRAHRQPVAGSRLMLTISSASVQAGRIHWLLHATSGPAQWAIPCVCPMPTSAADS